MYMDNFYNSDNLCKDVYAEKKMFHGVDRTHGQGVPEEIIEQEVQSKKKGQRERRSKSGGDEG